MKNKQFENLWPSYQKFLVFAEPAAKWAHLSRTIGKPYQSKDGAKGTFRLTNVLLAYNEAKCFQEKVIENINQLNLSEYLPEKQIKYWQNFAHVDLALAKWLAFAYLYWPNWHELDYLNKKDPRLAFLLRYTQLSQQHNQKWHSWLQLFERTLSSFRSQLPGDFLPKAIVLVEGVTEQLLLPCFAASCSIDLSSKGIMIFPSGGAKKLVRKYLYWKERVNIPIFCLLDADAGHQADEILSVLRDYDKIYVLTNGEIEDLIQLELLLDEVNNYLSCNPLSDSSKPVLRSDFALTQRRTSVLDKLWRLRNLGKFEKVKFAQFIANKYNDGNSGKELLSAEGKHMLNILVESVDSAQNK